MFGLQNLFIRVWWIALADAWANPFDIELPTQPAPLERD